MQPAILWNGKNQRNATCYTLKILFFGKSLAVSIYGEFVLSNIGRAILYIIFVVKLLAVSFCRHFLVEIATCQIRLIQ